MNAGPLAPATASLGRLHALAVVQGAVGFTGLYALSAVLPRMADDLGVSVATASWVPWAAQAGLMAIFLLWQFLAWAATGRCVVWLLVLLATTLAVGSVAPAVGWLLAPSAAAGAGTLVWSTLQTLTTGLALRRVSGGVALTQWLGAVMLFCGALGRWAVVEVAAAAGWRWALRALALAAAVAALAMVTRRFGTLRDAPHAGAEQPGARFGPAHRRARRWGSVVVALAGTALSLLDYYEPSALAATGQARAAGPLSFAYLLGGLVAALVVYRLRDRRGTAVVAAAVATFAGAAADLLGEVAFSGHAWLALQTLGRLSIESGTTVLMLSLAAMVGDRYGFPARFARAFAFWRCVVSTTVGLVAIPLWSGGRWLLITAASATAAALCVGAAALVAKRVVAGPSDI